MSYAKMKHMLVVANNKPEWDFFTQTLEWKCSKHNTVYKRIPNCFCDINDEVMYHVVYNNFSMKETLEQRVYNGYVLLCHENHVDMELLLSYIRGE